MYPLSGKLRCPECGRAFRHQVVNGTAQWICTCRSSGATDCQHRHVREEAVYEIFTDMVIKLKTYRNELLGTLIHQMELMQDRTSRNQERIRQIDKEIADLGAKNHIIARLHTSGALTAVEYAMQTSEIGNRLTELRIDAVIFLLHLFVLQMHLKFCLNLQLYNLLVCLLYLSFAFEL